jgi:malonyl-ACP decarboxylase
MSPDQIHKVCVTGMGVVTPVGIGIPAFTEALKNGKSNFAIKEYVIEDRTFKYIYGKVEDFDLKKHISDSEFEEHWKLKVKRLRDISLSTAYGTFCALEAWHHAKLPSTIDKSKIAIVVAGNNTQQQHCQDIRDTYKSKMQFMKPSYGFNFLDSDMIGVASELFEITGEGFTVGAASASGNMGIIQACRLIEAKDYDVVMVIAPMMDLSVYEYQGLSALGAMQAVSLDAEEIPLYKPFDLGHTGFVYGQNAGAIILESKEHAQQRKAKVFGTISGYGVTLDANRNPNPSVDGEQKAIAKAMQKAGIVPEQIDYINAHGTGSKLGDYTEIEALIYLELKNKPINSTKSLIGHGITAAGTVEAIASLIQMNENFVHENLNLKTPIDFPMDWIQSYRDVHSIKYTLSNSFGFGGINTAIILEA